MEGNMGIAKDDDCVERFDGTLVCWDRDDECLVLLNKKKITAADVTKDELLALARLMGKRSLK